MKWKTVLKMHCSTEKMGCDCSVCRDKTKKALSPKQRKLDRNKNNKIDADDFRQLREKKAEDPKETIISTLEKEGGASGLEPLEEATKLSKDKVKDMLNQMENVVRHDKGDYILLDGLDLPEDEEE
jgi:hypothetical protein